MTNYFFFQIFLLGLFVTKTSVFFDHPLAEGQKKPKFAFGQGVVILFSVSVFLH